MDSETDYGLDRPGILDLNRMDTTGYIEENELSESDTFQSTLQGSIVYLK